MQVETEVVDGVGSVRFEGDLEATALRRLKPIVDALLAKGTQRLVFDLEGVTFCDSMGAAYLLMTCKRTREKGGDVVLTAIPRQVHRTFSLLGVLDVFANYETAAEGREHFAEGREPPDPAAASHA